MLVLLGDGNIANDFCSSDEPYRNTDFWENIVELIDGVIGVPDDLDLWDKLPAAFPTVADLNISGDFSSISGLINVVAPDSSSCGGSFQMLDSGLYSDLETWLRVDGGTLVLIDEFNNPTGPSCYKFEVTGPHNVLLGAISATSRFGAAKLDETCIGEDEMGNGWQGVVNNSHALIDGTHGNVLTGVWHAATNVVSPYVDWVAGVSE